MTQCYNMGGQRTKWWRRVLFIYEGVDGNDWMTQCYNMGRQRTKWWRRVLFIYEGVDGND